MANLSLGASAHASASGVSTLSVVLTGVKKGSGIGVAVGSHATTTVTASVVDDHADPFVSTFGPATGHGLWIFQAVNVAGGDTTVTVTLSTTDTNLMLIAAEVRSSDGIVMGDGAAVGTQGLTSTTANLGPISPFWDPASVFFLGAFWDSGAAPTSYTNLTEVATESATGVEHLALASGTQPSARFGADFTLQALYGSSVTWSDGLLPFIDVPFVTGSQGAQAAVFGSSVYADNLPDILSSPVLFGMTGVPQGSTLVLLVAYSAFQTTRISGVADGKNVWSLRGTSTSPDGGVTEIWAAESAAAGSYSVTVVLSSPAGNTETQMALVVVAPALGGSLRPLVAGAGSNGQTSSSDQKVTTPAVPADVVLAVFAQDNAPPPPSPASPLTSVRVLADGTGGLWGVVGVQSSADPAVSIGPSGSFWTANGVSIVGVTGGPASPSTVGRWHGVRPYAAFGMQSRRVRFS